MSVPTYAAEDAESYARHIQRIGTALNEPVQIREEETADGTVRYTYEMASEPRLRHATPVDDASQHRMQRMMRDVTQLSEEHIIVAEKLARVTKAHYDGLRYVGFSNEEAFALTQTFHMAYWKSLCSVILHRE